MLLPLLQMESWSSFQTQLKSPLPKKPHLSRNLARCLEESALVPLPSISIADDTLTGVLWMPICLPANEDAQQDSTPHLLGQRSCTQCVPEALDMH